MACREVRRIVRLFASFSSGRMFLSRGTAWAKDPPGSPVRGFRPFHGVIARMVQARLLSPVS